MKLNSLLPFLAALALVSPVLAANKKHDPSDHTHEKKKVAGPNGGRIITLVEPRVEFFVTPDRKVHLTFLDQAGKPIAPADQVVTVTTGDRLSPTTLTFAKAGNQLVSSAALPKGNDLPAVVQIKTTPASKTVTAKFNLDLTKCGDCKHAEYACICDH